MLVLMGIKLVAAAITVFVGCWIAGEGVSGLVRRELYVSEAIVTGVLAAGLLSCGMLFAASVV